MNWGVTSGSNPEAERRGGPGEAEAVAPPVRPSITACSFELRCFSFSRFRFRIRICMTHGALEVGRKTTKSSLGGR